jgi:formiminoglutamase
MEIFSLANTRRPDESLFYRRGDPSDERLGEVVRTDELAYDAAQVVMLGCPQDEGVRRNRGRPGAAQAPDEIRRCLYRLGVANLEGLLIVDLGNTVIQATLEETHALHQAVVAQVIRDGKMLISLGGGNDVSYPDCAALASVVGDILAFNVDAHFDVRADAVRNSGTPYRQLIEDGFIRPDRFYEMGYQPFANSLIYAQYLREHGAHVQSLADLREGGLMQAFRNALRTDAAAIFWGFDLDAVCAADAPGVSAPSPLGLTGDEFCQLAALAGSDPRTRVVEFSEVNPRYDLDQRTCRLTAVAIWRFLSAVAERQS